MFLGEMLLLKLTWKHRQVGGTSRQLKWCLHGQIKMVQFRFVKSASQTETMKSPWLAEKSLKSYLNLLWTQWSSPARRRTGSDTTLPVRRGGRCWGLRSWVVDKKKHDPAIIWSVWGDEEQHVEVERHMYRGGGGSISTFSQYTNCTHRRSGSSVTDQMHNTV